MGEVIPADAVPGILKRVQDMERPVQVEVLGTDTESGSWTAKLLEELAELTPKLTVVREPADVPEDVPPRRPVMLVGRNLGYHIRYYGPPAGEEAWGLLETLVMASKGAKDQVQIAPGKRLRVLTFVTSNCPYCPNQVLLNNYLAVVMPGIAVSETVMAEEFPDWAESEGVSAVPLTKLRVQAGKEEIEETLLGLQPGERYFRKVLSLLGAGPTA